jgi:hypothetical protein
VHLLWHNKCFVFFPLFLLFEQKLYVGYLSKVCHPFSWRALHALLQLKRNSSELARHVKTSLILCRIHTCGSTRLQPQSDSRFTLLPVSLFNCHTSQQGNVLPSSPRCFFLTFHPRKR